METRKIRRKKLLNKIDEVKEKVNSATNEVKQEIEVDLEQLMLTKLDGLVAERDKFFTRLLPLSKGEIVRVFKSALYRNTDRKGDFKPRPGNEAAAAAVLRGILDDEMSLGIMQLSLAAKKQEEIEEQLKQEELATKGESNGPKIE